MPYKSRLKTGGPRKRPKPNYSVTNAHEYNESLKRRGQRLDGCRFCRGNGGRTALVRIGPANGLELSEQNEPTSRDEQAEESGEVVRRTPF